MASIDTEALRSRARRQYEWARVRRALWGFSPAWGIVAVACALSARPASALAFGFSLFVCGVALLWYGKEGGKAVLPGVALGVFPLALALCANRMGHVCTGSSCVALCIPACLVGGLVAGAGISLVGVRRRHGIGFWLGASLVTLLTGAMGCSCVSFGGLTGMLAGYAIGVLPPLVRRATRGPLPPN